MVKATLKRDAYESYPVDVTVVWIWAPNGDYIYNTYNHNSVSEMEIDSVMVQKGFQPDENVHYFDENGDLNIALIKELIAALPVSDEIADP